MKLLAIDGNSILNRAFYGIRPLSKIHRATVTQAELNYVGSITFNSSR